MYFSYILVFSLFTIENILHLIQQNAAVGWLVLVKYELLLVYYLQIRHFIAWRHIFVKILLKI